MREAGSRKWTPCLARLALCGACVGRIGWSGIARAADPLNSSDRTSSQDSADRGKPHTELNAVPVAGGTTDIGFGVGEFAGLTRVAKGVDPYIWNLESAGLVTGRIQNGRFDAPYQNIYFKLTVPRFVVPMMRLEIRAEYSSEQTLGYYGLGNASSDAVPAGASSSYNWYGRVHPNLDTTVRLRLLDHLSADVGAVYTQNWLQVAGGTRLAHDLETAAAPVKAALGRTDPHGVATFHYGVQWDDRDSEVSPHHGSHDELRVGLSPGGTDPLPYRFARITAIGTLFVPVLCECVTLAVRGVADVLLGDPPFYELSRYDDNYAIGSLNGVRGVPGQRYYGKTKALGNVETRVDVTKFRLFSKEILAGAVAFFDAGRVWAGPGSRLSSLDGTGLGLKYGLGVGVRFRSGEAFVLRGDIAWSPDARPIGGYVAAGQAFSF